MGRYLYQVAAHPIYGLLRPFVTAVTHRQLIARLARREIEARYRGSVLGIVWSFITPLMMLSVYTFVFSVIFDSKWGGGPGTSGDVALLLFCGLIVYNIFGESVNRSPGLMLENVAYIKRVVFPTEIMAWVVIVTALFNAAVSGIVLLVFHLVLRGLPPPSSLLLPVVVLPLTLFTVGIVWFLASIGTFLRDIRQFIGVFTTLLMFISPIFYPVSAVPAAFRGLLYANPLSPVIEEARAVLFWGQLPDWLFWGLYLGGGWCVAWLGFVWFMRTRQGFADVV